MYGSTEFTFCDVDVLPPWLRYSDSCKGKNGPYDQFVTPATLAKTPENGPGPSASDKFYPTARNTNYSRVALGYL
jgi:hypothetical protein